jgi:sodium-dependent dicarboxylate transporter 2/3/5
MSLSPEAVTLAWILAGVVLLWVTEILPLPVTALLGAVACVVGGVAPAKDVFQPFSEPLVFLFIGSFILAEAIRIHRLDRRLAYAVLGLPAVGERPGRILVAVAVVSAVTSGFISNTATTAMMVAIVLGILAAVEEAGRRAGHGPDPGFATGLLLCVAFSASIGGLATPIGTPPNVIGLAFIRKTVGVEITFFQWCLVGTPVAVALVTLSTLLLLWFFPAGVSRVPGMREIVAEERKKLGTWTVGQRSTALAFIATVLMWVVPGLTALLLPEEHVARGWLRTRLPESVAAVIGAILLFLLPGDRVDAAGMGRRPRAISWSQAASIDWGIILLYGGGMALGSLAFSTGLAEAIGRGLTRSIPDGGGWLLVAAAAIVAVLTSEFTSNTASATMVVPVAIALAQASGGDPLPAAVAATLAASLGFMMPVSTPCNAIVYGSGRVPLRAMIRSGVSLDLLGAATVTAVVMALSELLRS